MFKAIVFTFIMISLPFFQVTVANQAQNTSPDWELTSIDGQSYQLSSLYDEGYAVMLVFGATWCSYSWDLVNQGTLDKIHDQFGPDATNELKLIFIEADEQTTLEHLKGKTTEKDKDYTLGDWVSGHAYTICNEEKLAKRYEVDAYPTSVLLKEGKSPLKIMGADPELINHTEEWLHDGMPWAMGQPIDTIAQESTALRSFGFSEQCQARGFAGNVDEINKTLNGVDFGTTADKLEAYFRDQLGVDGSWDYSEEKAGKMKLYRKCYSDSDCVELTIGTIDPDMTTFRVMKGARDTIYRKTDKPTATFAIYNLRRNGDAKSPQLSQAILSYNKGKKVESMLLTNESNCKKYRKLVARGSKKAALPNHLEENILNFAAETERLCEEGGFGHLFE